MSEIIVITGVTRGLGRALAAEFFRLGHVVLGCGRDSRTIEALRSAWPGADLSVVDVTDEAQVALWAAALLARYGAPHRVLNNAALINRLAPLWQVPAEEFDRLIEVNVKGVARVARHFLPAMIAAGRGVVVNFSSGWGRGTDAGVAPYCASKWAIEGLTRALAQELPAPLAAVPLNPGIIDTDMLRIAFGEQAGQYPAPETWARIAAPFLLALGHQHNGQPVTVPQ